MSELYLSSETTNHSLLYLKKMWQCYHNEHSAYCLGCTHTEYVSFTNWAQIYSLQTGCQDKTILQAKETTYHTTCMSIQYIQEATHNYVHLQNWKRLHPIGLVTRQKWSLTRFLTIMDAQRWHINDRQSGDERQENNYTNRTTVAGTRPTCQKPHGYKRRWGF